MQVPVQMLQVRRPTRCACGEGMGPGDRAGRIGGRRELLCLWCLADLQAGRERPRRRANASPVPAPAARRPRRERRFASPSATRRTKPRGRPAAVVAAVFLAAAGAFYVRSTVLGGSSGDVAAGVHIPGTDLVIGGGSPAMSKGGGDIHQLWPPVPSDAADRPLGAPPAQTSSSTEFTFFRTVDDGGTRPVAWDPCRPIHLVVNDARAPLGADQLLREAVAQISSATGLQFVFDGASDEAPSIDRAPQDEARYGNRWSPVLVAWTDPATIPQLAGAVAGLGGPEGARYYVVSQEHWVSGSVSLDGPQLTEVLQRPDGWAVARAIVMHELGHLVGLKHVSDPSELMYPRSTGQTAFGPGDREGLRQLGLGPCFSE